jgi:hypothetical protein
MHVPISIDKAADDPGRLGAARPQQDDLAPLTSPVSGSLETRSLCCSAFNRQPALTGKKTVNIAHPRRSIMTTKTLLNPEYAWCHLDISTHQTHV